MNCCRRLDRLQWRNVDRHRVDTRVIPGELTRRLRKIPDLRYPAFDLEYWCVTDHPKIWWVDIPLDPDGQLLSIGVVRELIRAMVQGIMAAR